MQNFKLGSLTNAAELVELCLIHTVCLKTMNSSSDFSSLPSVLVNILCASMTSYSLPWDLNFMFYWVHMQNEISLDAITIWAYEEGWVLSNVSMGREGGKGC